MRNLIMVFAGVFFLWGCGRMTVRAEEAPDLGEGLLEDMDLGAVDETLEDLLGDTDFSFSGSVKKLMNGEIPLTWDNLKEIVKSTLFSGIGEYRKTAVQVLILVIVSAIFTNFTNVFEKSQVADISFYMMYLLLFAILMKAFYSLSQLTVDAMASVLTFMKILMPSYLVASVFASGSVTGAAYYEFTLLLITLIQSILKYLVVPAVNLFVLFMLLDHLSKEEYFSKMAELIKLFVEWTLKTLFAAVVGFQVVQCLILPAVDSLKTTVINKTAGAIPGIGNVFNSVTEVVLGSAVLIKNAIGVAGLLVILSICLIPLVKLGISALLYRLVSAVIQPISDKRMVECISSVGVGAGLLLRILGTTGVLFFITIAMVTASIRGG